MRPTPQFAAHLSTATRPIARAVVFAILAARPAAAPALAADGLPTTVPEPVTAATVARIVDGDTIVLDGGAQVRLTGIQAPKLPLGRPGFRAWPLAAEARDALADMCRGRQVTLRYDGRRIDRWRRLLAQVTTVAADGAPAVWLQREMVRRGLARVYTFRDNAGDADALYAAEREARAAHRGIWADPWYRILSPADAAGRIGSFQIVEGRAMSASVVGGRGFVNFGPDWRTDFTIAVSRRDMRTFRAAGIDLKSLSGRRLRVRGWLIRENGAMIRATHPQQMEVLDR